MTKLYTQNGCGQCKMVHMLLDKKKIPYEEVIITLDTIDQYKEMGITKTPTLDVDGVLLVGKDLISWINGR